MKNKVLNKKIYEARNNVTTSHTSIDNIPDEILHDQLDDFFDVIDFDTTMRECVNLFSLFTSYDSMISYPKEEFVEYMEKFYIMNINDIIEMVNKWYDSNEFYTLAKNLFVNTNDIVEMHKLKNKVIDNTWMSLLDYIHTTLYGDEIGDYIQITKRPNARAIELLPTERVARYFTLAFSYHVSDYECIVNSDRFKEFCCEY